MSARGRVGFLLWFVLPVACCPQHAAMLEKRSPVMQIKFARSGGFAGAATNIEGTVAFDQKGARVTSDASRYHRELTVQEAAQLRAAADPSRLSKVQSELSSRPKQVRDVYQYDVTVATQDGKIHKLTLNADGELDELSKISADLLTLVRWIQQESQAIWLHRASKR